VAAAFPNADAPGTVPATAGIAAAADLQWPGFFADARLRSLERQLQT